MGLLSSASSAITKHSCPPLPSLAENAIQPFVGSLTFYHFNMILSGCSTAVSCLLMFTLMSLHATHLSVPNEQIKMIRICGLVPVYSILSFLIVCLPSTYIYLNSWIDVYQAVVLASFFLLLREFLLREDREYRLGADADPSENKGGQALDKYHERRKRSLFIFQYPIVSLGVAIATDATQSAGVYCRNESSVHFAHIWLSIISNLSLSVALFSVLKLYIQSKPALVKHHAITRFAAFKLIVALSFIQSIIFWVLSDTNSLNPTPKMTYADLNYGIPTMLNCLEMVLFSFLFWFSYGHRPYVLSKNSTIEDPSRNLDPSVPQKYHGGPLGIWAWLGIFDLRDLLRGIMYSLS